MCIRDRQEPSRPGRANIWHLSMHTRACTAGLRPKQTCSNISASAHLQSTKWCLRSNAQGSSADSAASLAVSKCSLIQNTCRSYDEPRSTSQNLCAEVLAHDPEKWEPVFGKDHAPSKTLGPGSDSTPNDTAPAPRLYRAERMPSRSATRRKLDLCAIKAHCFFGEFPT